MDGYILELKKYGHLIPKKPQYSPHKHRHIDYRSTQQIVQPADPSPPLNDKDITRVQGIVGASIYVGIAVNNKLLATLSAIGAQQAAATEETVEAIEQLLDYVATYPNNGIIFRKSDMILAAHADAGFLNKSKARSRAGAHILLSENDHKPKINGPVLTIAHIIKPVMVSAAESEIAALCITEKKMIPLCNTLIEMGWQQPPTAIQTDNSTAVGFTTKTMVNKATKSADMKLWWTRDRQSQDQFRYYWATRYENEGDYSTKHHHPIYHEAKRANPYLV